ncbi:stage V sporulation protein B [Clostridium moniliforme]|uniref:Multidrug-efflux transporter n=1 Tax=Clostridium moniliforme TaxID=39489 RepID=A0ABS4EYA1_9CLOT|nr:stage V sporulation protein B [Clostridium moniliforme]MBP1888972.1 stage V sporulation protein B [Clostridium moniliforme]
MEKDNFFKNSFMLTASNITTGLLGFAFSIYLSKILGAEGIGLYNIIMPIYNLFICLMTAGIVAALSKVSAVYSERNETNNLTKTINSVALFNIIWALLIGVLVFFLAPLISKYGINDIRTINAIKVTCPAMVFISLSNILKGYFLGVSKIKVPALIDIFEKGMRIITITILVYAFSTNNLTTLVTLAYVSLAIGEFQSLVLLFIYYRKCIKKLPKSNVKADGRAQLLFNVLIISLPLCINGFLSNIFATLSTLIVPRRLLVAGFSYVEALSLIGKYTGMAVTLIGIPLIVVNSINSLLIPDLSQSLSRGDSYEASVRIKKVMKISFLLGLSTTVICSLIPYELGNLFYSRNDLGSFIFMASLAAPIFFTSSIMFGVLNGLNKQGIIVRNSFIIALIEVICLFIFTSIPNINIYGYSITLFITSSFSILLNLHEVKKEIRIDISLTNVVIFILLSILTFLILNIFIKRFLYPLNTFETLFVILITFLIFIYYSKFGEY